MAEHQEYDPVTDSVVSRFVLEIPAGRCAWAAQAGGGCFMCGFNAPSSLKSRWTFRGRPWPNFLAKLYIGRRMRQRLRSPTVLAVFHGGSFLNPEEVPIPLQDWIASLCAHDPDVIRLFIESRAEYVTASSISRLRSILGSTALEVAVGLESASDWVRNGILNKGLQLQDYRKAIKVIHDNGGSAFTYVFLKPPFLSEGEAIANAVASVRFAFEAGSDAVSLSCGAVQRGTPLHALWQQKKYRPPWLWSIIETVRRCSAFGTLRVGTFDDEPMPLDQPRNCGRCDSFVCDMLDEYRRSHDVGVFSGPQDLSCGCRHEWEGVVA